MSDELEEIQQEKLHSLLQNNLPFTDEGSVLNGWIIIYETVRPEYGKLIKECGHIYGPATMKTWNALGLIEWARRFSLGPDDEKCE